MYTHEATSWVRGIAQDSQGCSTISGTSAWNLKRFSLVSNVSRPPVDSSTEIGRSPVYVLYSV